MKMFLGLLMISILTMATRAQGEPGAPQGALGNQTSSDLEPLFKVESPAGAEGTEIDYSFIPVSCLPDKINKPGIYRVSRSLPLSDQNGFSTFELYLHINYDEGGDQLLISYISGYQGKVVLETADNQTTSNQWGQASAALGAYYKDIGLTPAASARISFDQTEKDQILGLGLSEFSCDQSKGVISWDTGDNDYYGGSKGKIKLVAPDEKRVIVHGEIAMYYLSGILYEYVESFVNRYINNRGATVRLFEMIPLKGGRLAAPKIEGVR